MNKRVLEAMGYARNAAKKAAIVYLTDEREKLISAVKLIVATFTFSNTNLAVSLIKTEIVEFDGAIETVERLGVDVLIGTDDE